MELPIKLQELAGLSGAGIGDEKADSEIGGGFRKLVEKTLLRQIRHHVAVLHVEAIREALSHFVEQLFPSSYKHYVEPLRRDLPRKFFAYSGRGTRDKCPGADPFFIECYSHPLLHSACLGLVVFACISQSTDSATGRSFCQIRILVTMSGGLRLSAGQAQSTL